MKNQSLYGLFLTSIGAAAVFFILFHSPLYANTACETSIIRQLEELLAPSPRGNEVVSRFLTLRKKLEGVPKDQAIKMHLEPFASELPSVVKNIDHFFLANAESMTPEARELAASTIKKLKSLSAERLANKRVTADFYYITSLLVQELRTLEKQSKSSQLNYLGSNHIRKYLQYLETGRAENIKWVEEFIQTFPEQIYAFTESQVGFRPFLDLEGTNIFLVGLQQDQHYSNHDINHATRTLDDIRVAALSDPTRRSLWMGFHRRVLEQIDQYPPQSVEKKAAELLYFVLLHERLSFRPSIVDALSKGKESFEPFVKYSFSRSSIDLGDIDTTYLKEKYFPKDKSLNECLDIGYKALVNAMYQSLPLK